MSTFDVTNRKTIKSYIANRIGQTCKDIKRLEIINKYLNNYYLTLVDDDKKFEYYDIIIEPATPGNYHYLNNNVKLIRYSDSKSAEYKDPKAVLTFNINELFGNCGAVCINSISFSYFDKPSEGYEKILLQLGEEIAYLFGYSYILYTINNKEQIKIKEALDNLKYNIIDTFKNERMDSVIEVYTKKIN